jgi:gluconolactonase
MARIGGRRYESYWRLKGAGVLEIHAFSEEIYKLVNIDARLRRIATGYNWAEGPIWDSRSGILYFTDYIKDEIYSWREGENTQIVRRNTGKACGLTFDSNNSILCAEGESRKITRFVPGSDEVTMVAAYYNGKRLNAPNDVVVHSGGAVYFTDPFPVELGHKKELEVNGVYCVWPGEENVVLLDDLPHPNGIAFSPDESLLYISDTKLLDVFAYNVQPDGSIIGKRLFAHLDAGMGTGLADGMKVDRDGNVFVTGPVGIWVFRPDGKPLGIIDAGEIAANLCFGGNGFSSLFITASSSVYMLETKTAGAEDSSLMK